MLTAAIVSFRLGGSDGVSVEAGKWAWALGRLGLQVITVAGEGPVDRLLPGLSIGSPTPPAAAGVDAALAGTDLVVIENLCSLPLNPAAAAVVASACRDRPAILHHHDLAWQRPALGTDEPPPDDPAWRHVTINERSRTELAVRGIDAVTVYNTFDMAPPIGRRHPTRRALGIGDGTTLVLQPTRALPRKNVAGGLALAHSLGATYWLLGPAEDGYGPELERLVAAATCPVRRGAPRGIAAFTVADAYAACDVVTLPSTWEGFGNPALESAAYRKPLAIGQYPVASELAAFGFEWFGLSDVAGLRRWLGTPDQSLLEHNRAVAARHFDLARLPARVGEILSSMGILTTPQDGPPGAS